MNRLLIEALEDGNPKRVLVAFERSGQVRRAFDNLYWHEDIACFSCDLEPSDDESPRHIQADAFEAITFHPWDLIIMHPPCTALAVSGNRHYGKGKPKHAQRLRSIDYTMELWQTAKTWGDRVAMENPVGVIPMQASQYIQPWEYGHPESKKTGLWLYDLPPLTPTDNVKAEYDALPKAQAQRIHYMPPSADRARLRSETFEGIAYAMAEQWGGIL